MTLSLKSRWTLSIAISVAISLCVLGYVTLSISKSKMHEALLHDAEQNLTSQKILVKQQISAYFANVEQQLLVMANSKNTLHAAKDFLGSYYNYSNGDSINENNQDVKDYYSNQFVKVYFDTNNERVNPATLVSKLTPSSAALQSDYIANNRFELGKKDALMKVGNQTDYDKHHGVYHPDYSAFVSAFGYYDLFIVDANKGDIIYSVYKEVDFATNLLNGSFNQSGLAEAFEEGKKLDKNTFYLTEFSPYTPSYEAPAGFISSPIYDGNTVIAVLIFQMPIDTIADIMNQDQKWTERGFGRSGEVYLVGGDKTLRSESRFYVESPNNFINLLESLNIPEVQSIKRSDTTITKLKVNSVSATNGLAGKTGFDIINDYRNVNILSSYSPVNFGNLNWVIIAEIEEKEAFAFAHDLEAQLTSTIIVGIFVCTTIFVVIALLMTRRLIKPLVNMGTHFQSLTKGEADLALSVPSSNIPEINAISFGFNTFVGQLRNIIDEVKSNALTVATASEELSASTNESSNAAQYQQRQTEEVMHAINEFNVSVKDVSMHSEKASHGMVDAQQRTTVDSKRASTAADNITALVSEVNSSAATILQLKEEVQNINVVLAVINGIADQTNLLALNAAIEAARAGEHGRGFSVVADEVRTLASSTQKSTIDIQDKITTLTTVAEKAVESMERASVSATQGVELVQSVSVGLNDMTHSIEDLASINQKVADTSQIQKTTSENISQNIHTVSSASNQLSASSNEARQASQELALISNNLQELVERFRT